MLFRSNGVPEDPSISTKMGKRVLEIKQIFGSVCCGDRDIDPFSTDPVVWHGRKLAAVSPDIAPWVLWEAFELGFRYELLALDQLLRPSLNDAEECAREEQLAKIFPQRCLRAVPALPGLEAFGLFAPLPHRRVNALNALRQVLVRWTGSPMELRQAQPLRLSSSVQSILEMEEQLADFYVETFVAIAMRAPIVPHIAPFHVEIERDTSSGYHV